MGVKEADDMNKSYKSFCTFMRHEQGQMTLEFMVMLPVILMIVFVAYNTILFFSECASFDRVFRQSVVSQTISPHAYQDNQMSVLDEALQANFDHDYLTWEISAVGEAGSIQTYTAKLFFTPTFFGNGAIHSIFELQLPPLTHHVQVAVNPYKPGIFL